MAELEEALHTRLTGFAGLSALIGTRVYPQLLPQDPTYPALTYARIDGAREQTLSGDAGLAHPTIQFDAWDTTLVGARAVIAQVHAALHRQGWTEDSTTILDAFNTDEQDDFDVLEDNSIIYQSQRSYEIWLRE